MAVEDNGNLSFVPQGVQDYMNEYGLGGAVGLRPSDADNNIGGSGFQFDTPTAANNTGHGVIAADAHGSAYYQQHPGAANGVSDEAYAAAQAGSGWAIGGSGQRVYVGTTNGTAPNVSTGPFVSSAGQGGTQAQRDAFGLIRQNLSTYSLPDTLADWAWQEIVQGKGNAEIMLDLQQRPEYKQAFPEIDARRKAGLAPLSPGDIVNYRQQARQMMQAAGLPAGFYDSPQDFSKFLMNDTSLAELSTRITDAAQAAYNAPPEYKQQWDQLGFGHGDLTAMMLNPDVAEPLLHKQWTAAQLAGTGVRTGYGQLNANQALGLTDLGVTVSQAEQGFGNLAHQQELFNPLNGGETAINQNEQLAAQFGGNAQAQQRIQDRARSRVATFSGGGGFAGTTGGYSAVGNSGQ